MNTLATEFIALLGDAKAGRPNEARHPGQHRLQSLLLAPLQRPTPRSLLLPYAAGLLDGIYTLT
jgi:hypothetical protein